MENIQDIVKTVIGSISTAKENEQEVIVRTLEKTLKNKKLLKNIKIDGKKDGVLFVNVSSPAYLYQCKIKQGVVTRELQKEVKDLKKIYFKIGKVT